MGTLSDDGSENVGKKMNLRSFKLRLFASIWTRSICQIKRE